MDSGIESSIERFRPAKLCDMVGQEEAVKVVKGLLDAHRGNPTSPFPNLLFSGPPGVGKTTLAFIIARELYGDGFADDFLDMNASKDRGIEAIRERVDKWCGYMPSSGAPFKLLFLDEADRLTPDAQTALRRIIEDASTTRFILSANYPTRLIPAIRSRLAPVRFKPIKRDDMQKILSSASTAMGINIPPSSIDLYATWAGGDARRAINLMVSQGIDETAVEELNEWLSRVIGLLNGSSEPRKRVVEGFLKFMRESGLEIEDTLAILSERVALAELAAEKEAKAQLAIADTAYRATMVATPILQLRAMLYRW